MKDEAHGVHSMLLCKTGKYSVMLTVMELMWLTGKNYVLWKATYMYIVLRVE